MTDTGAGIRFSGSSIPVSVPGAPDTVIGASGQVFRGAGASEESGGARTGTVVAFSVVGGIAVVLGVLVLLQVRKRKRVGGSETDSSGISSPITPDDGGEE